jgi:hypothetical protein
MPMENIKDIMMIGDYIGCDNLSHRFLRGSINSGLANTGLQRGP